jgi:soluble lytic murein transglycosylase-like protein
MTASGNNTYPGRGALRRPMARQGPSVSLRLAAIPAGLFLLLTVSVGRAWQSLKAPYLALAKTGQTASHLRVETLSSTQALSPAFPPQVLRWSRDIDTWSHTYGLDPNLIAVVMQIESCGDPGARSPSGALGLFQVMPYHFEPGDDPLDPDTNARRALTYLATGLQLAHQDPMLALAGYNGGHGVIHLDMPAWPDETRRYVQWGLGILNDIASGRVPSPTLTRWLGAGGSTLCVNAQAAAQPAAYSP